MKSRLIASLALGAVVLLGTTGCAMLSTQASDPPPAPISIISITGIEIGIPEPLAKRVLRHC